MRVGRSPSVAIIGAGFGGLGLAIQLNQAGFDNFTIIEKADEVGGVWRDNSYPGLACDVPSDLYSFSFAPNYDWSRRFPLRDEIFAYLQRVTDEFEIRRHIRFGTEVESAVFEESTGQWVLALNGPGEGDLEADVLVSATGQLSRPSYPLIPGLEQFEGHSFHSARWDHDYELDGKRVAVIGTGATATQFIPEIAPRAERLHVFQRSAPYIINKPDRPVKEWQRALIRRLPWIQKLSRGIIYARLEIFMFMFTKARFGLAYYRADMMRKLRRDVADLELRKQLEPGYPMGCKRVVISNDWFQTLARPDVEVVGDPIAAITPKGVRTGDGVEREVDALILATGFQANDFLAPMEIRGLGGVELNDVWREGAEAYLGMTVSRFPNMFMLYGPNTNLAAGSIIFMLESQIRYVLGAVRALAASDNAYFDLLPEVQRGFNAEIQSRLSGSVWESCNSWYRTPSGRVTNNWPGQTLEYRHRTQSFDPRRYRVAYAAGSG